MKHVEVKTVKLVEDMLLAAKDAPNTTDYKDLAFRLVELVTEETARDIMHNLQSKYGI